MLVKLDKKKAVAKWMNIKLSVNIYCDEGGKLKAWRIQFLYYYSKSKHAKINYRSWCQPKCYRNLPNIPLTYPGRLDQFSKTFLGMSKNVNKCFLMLYEMRRVTCSNNISPRFISFNFSCKKMNHNNILRLEKQLSLTKIVQIQTPK